MEDLKPCPFCGSEAETNVSYAKIDGHEVTMCAEVSCSNKQCRVGKCALFMGTNVRFEEYISAFEKAIAAWNRRAKE